MSLDAAARTGDFRIGDVVRGTFRIAKLNFWGFALVALVVVAMPTWLGPLLTAPVLDGLKQAELAGSVSTGWGFALGFALGAAPGVVGRIGGIVLTGMVVRAALDRFAGRPVSFGTGLRTGLACFPGNLALTVLFYLAVALGSVLLVVPGLVLSYAWLVILPVHVAERGPLLSAFGRSWRLTAGHRWRIVGLTLVYGFLAGFLIGAASGFATGLASQHAPSGIVLAAKAVAAVFTVVLSVISSAGVTALYLALRGAKEGALSADLVDAFA